MISFFNSIPPSLAISVAAIFATVGWLYTARRSRILARKQHTFNTLTAIQFQMSHREAFELVSAYVNTNPRSNIESAENAEIKKAARLLLNHFEFISAGIRRGDLDERLVFDTYRSTIRVYFESFEDFIYSVRNGRQRASIYEHIEWLYIRWEREPPGLLKHTVERCKGSPLYGRRVKVRH